MKKFILVLKRKNLITKNIINPKFVLLLKKKYEEKLYYKKNNLFANLKGYKYTDILNTMNRSF